jgi:hypothetical protein
MSTDKLYYNFERMSGTPSSRTFVITPSNSALPTLRWGKTDYKAVSMTVRRASTGSDFYLVVLCEGGNKNISFCLPLKPGSPSDSGLDNLITALADATSTPVDIELNNHVTDQAAQVYNNDTIVLTSPSLVTPAVLANKAPKAITVPALVLSTTPAGVDIYHQAMDWMIDCELVGEDGSEQTQVAQTVSGSTTMVGFVVGIVAACTLLYYAVPVAIDIRFGNNPFADPQTHWDLRIHVGMGTFLSILSLAIWGGSTGKKMEMTYVILTLLAVTTVSYYSFMHSFPLAKHAQFEYFDGFNNKRIVSMILYTFFVWTFAGFSYNVVANGFFWFFFAILILWTYFLYSRSTMDELLATFIDVKP